MQQLRHGLVALAFGGVMGCTALLGDFTVRSDGETSADSGASSGNSSSSSSGNPGSSGNSTSSSSGSSTSSSSSGSVPPGPRKLNVVMSGSGKGSVTSVPTGIACGPGSGQCDGVFAGGTLIKLSAQAKSGYVFSGWTGLCTGLVPSCDLTLTNDATVGAGFGTPATWDSSFGVLNSVDYSSGNLTAASSSSLSSKIIRATVGRDKNKGKLYWEVSIDTMGGSLVGSLGIIDENVVNGTEAALGDSKLTKSCGFTLFQGNVYCSWPGASVPVTNQETAPAAVGAVYMVALDTNSGTLWFGRNGTWFKSGNPATGANPTIVNLSGTVYPAFQFYKTVEATVTANFGAKAMKYPVPYGFAPGFYKD